jgi:hypothetical protein
VSRLLQVVFAGVHKSGQVDLEAVETLVRGSMHRAGAALLGRLLSAPCSEASPPLCICGHTTRRHDRRSRQVLTALGPVQFERDYYLCPRCHRGQSPRDRELDVESTEFSPGVRRMMAAVGSEASFQQGREQLELLAGLEVTAKAVERQTEASGVDIEAAEQKEIHLAKQLDLPEVCAPAVPVLYVLMDGTGVPVTPKEREGRASKTEGQPARTRDVKLGCLFTQTSTDKDGRPIRDPDSTSYVAAIEIAEQFGLRLYAEAWRRGWSKARQKAVLGDGAIWIWNLADQHFPGAVQIVDLYHARQHVWELAAKLFANDEPARRQWASICQYLLDEGEIEALLTILRHLRPDNERLAHEVGNDADYFARNAERMRYPQFRAQGLFVGSGVVEAGCRTVVGKRMKCSGMFWSVRGANAILALRCCRLSSRFEDYWASRSRAA